jgi:hypothetical protein
MSYRIAINISCPWLARPEGEPKLGIGGVTGGGAAGGVSSLSVEVCRRKRAPLKVGPTARYIATQNADSLVVVWHETKTRD